MKKLTKQDNDVIHAFLSHTQGESKNLWTDGTSLDGRWMGGAGIATWVVKKKGRQGFLRMRDLGSKAADKVQREVGKKAEILGIAFEEGSQPWGSARSDKALERATKRHMTRSGNTWDPVAKVWRK